jgi:hypothetical protein
MSGAGLGATSFVWMDPDDTHDPFSCNVLG